MSRGLGCLPAPKYTVAYIKLCIYRGWQASHRKCAISDIAITSARNNIFWQDKKQLIGHREGFIYFWYRGVQGACQHPNIYIYIYQNKTQKMQTKCFMVITNLQCARMNKLQIHNIANYSFIKLFSLKVLIS